MLSKKDIENIRQSFAKYDYIMTTAQLNKDKLYYRDIQGLFPDAVLCMETALFYYKYSDRNPAEWNIAIDKNASRQRLKIDYPFIKAYRVEPSLLSLGETGGKIDFEKIRIYDRDRTICDVLRNMNKMDKEIFNKAIQNYVKDPKKNISNLMKYAKVLRVQKRVKDLIGVWL